LKSARTVWEKYEETSDLNQLLVDVAESDLFKLAETGAGPRCLHEDTAEDPHVPDALVEAIETLNDQYQSCIAFVGEAQDTPIANELPPSGKRKAPEGGDDAGDVDGEGDTNMDDDNGAGPQESGRNKKQCTSSDFQ
jgi:hypothetical protein